jgi:hypothetical protein
MARLVVALVALAIMSAGSMYWAAAQQDDPSSGSVKHGPYSGIAARALPADQATQAAADAKPCAAKDGCGCGCNADSCDKDAKCEGGSGCPAQGSCTK